MQTMSSNVHSATNVVKHIASVRLNGTLYRIQIRCMIGMPQKYGHFKTSYNYQLQQSTECMHQQNMCSLNIPNPLVQNSTPTLIKTSNIQP